MTDGREPKVGQQVSSAGTAEAVPDQGGGPNADRVDEVRCVGCGSAVAGTYCAACGARVEPPPLELRSFLADALSELLSIERGLVRTLRDLFARPGSVTVAFREGHGAVYTPPVKLYLATAFVYFGGLTLVGADTLYLWTLIITLSSGSLPGWVSQIVLLGVPLVALIARGIFFGTGRYYVELLVLSLYFHGFLFLVGVPVSLAWQHIPVIADNLGRANNWFALVAGIWLFLAFRRVTRAGRLRCLLGTVLATAVYLAFMLSGIYLWVILAGGSNG